jgi:CheY-like chemotaxis protein
MDIDPRFPFQGASDLMELVAFTLRSKGERNALLVHTNAHEADRLAGMLGGLGLSTEWVVTGKQALRRAAMTNPDIELILVSDAVSRPRWTELVQQLRFEPRTAWIPLALVVTEKNLDRADQLARHHVRTIAFPWPHDAESLNSLLGRALPLAGEDPLTAPERSKLARDVASWLEHIARDRQTYWFYELDILPPERWGQLPTIAE